MSDIRLSPSGPVIAGASEDHKVAVTTNDTGANFLASKISAAPGIALAIVNPGGNEQLKIDAVTPGALLALTVAPQVIADTVPTQVAFDTTGYDTNLYASGGGGLTIPAGLAGKYLLQSQVVFQLAAPTTASLRLRLLRNGSAVVSYYLGLIAATVNPTLTVSVVGPAAAGDVFTVEVTQISGGPLSLDNAADSTGFWIARLGS